MTRTTIINKLIQKHGYKSYLEVGTQNPTSNFMRVNCDHKFCIEPFPTQYGPAHDWTDMIDFVGTSDEYFDTIKGTDTKYDIVFIDGLHQHEQVLKDINNSLNHLNEGGTIVCHDCLPTHPTHALREDPGGTWNGDVWKALAELRITRDDLIIHTINTDFGCGIIQKGKSDTYKPTGSWDTWEYYDTHKHEMMNVVGTNTNIL